MRLRFNLLMIICIMLIACDYVDFSGIVTSLNTVNERFADQKNLPEVNLDATIDTDNFSFLVISDAHYYHENAGHLAKVARDSRFNDISFVILNGDSVQSGKQYQYNYIFEDMKNLTVPCFFGMGNHDLYNGGYQTYRSNVGRTIYTLHIGKTDIFVVDTGNGTLGTAQTRWLKSELEHSEATNKVVVTHYSFVDETFQSVCSFSYNEETYKMLDLFEQNEVDYCVMGHLHSYDEMTIRSVHYIRTANQASNDIKYAKFIIKNGKISSEVYR